MFGLIPLMFALCLVSILNSVVIYYSDSHGRFKFPNPTFFVFQAGKNAKKKVNSGEVSFCLIGIPNIVKNTLLHTIFFEILLVRFDKCSDV